MTFNNPHESGAAPEETELSYGAYERAGGILTRESYEAVIHEQKQKFLDDLNKGTYLLALNIARINSIRIDDEFCTTYDILRNKIKNIPNVNETDANTINKFSDQEVFAEVLLLQDRLAEHTDFVRAYPNIFERPIE